MGKQTRSRKAADHIGKGKVTPIQVAFIVDRYLLDNNFVTTRSTLRSEASHLFSKSPVNEAPKSLLSLGDMLDEYICLKEQKVILNQEKNRLEQDRFRVQTLLRGMQDAMNLYTHGPQLPSPAPHALTAPPPPPVAAAAPIMMPTSTNFSTPTTSQPAQKKRRNSKDTPAAPLASKRSRTQSSLRSSSTSSVSAVRPPTITPNTQQNTLQITPIPSNNKPSQAPQGGSSVAKCLFNPGPHTPSPSPTVSPSVDNQTPPCRKTVTPQQFTSTNRTVITSETIQVSPMKQVSYYSIERNHCITSPMKRFSTRDHVKGRLDFDGVADENNTSTSPSEDDGFDFELPNLDCLGADFNLTDLLGDFDLDFCQQENVSSSESLSGSPADTMVDNCTGDHELMSSTVTEMRSEQDMNMPGGAGTNSVTSMKSITKCIKVISPVKSRSPNL